MSNASSDTQVAPAYSRAPTIHELDVRLAIRAELHGPEALEQEAKLLGSYCLDVRVIRGKGQLLRGLLENGRILDEVHSQIVAAVGRGARLTPDAEWLLDNFYVIDEVLREVRHDLPRGYYRELPKLAHGPMAGYPRVYALALTLIAHSDSSLDETSLTRFMDVFQTVAPLTIGELWAVPTMLRLGLLENLRRLAEDMLSTWRAQQQGEVWCRSSAGDQQSDSDTWPPEPLSDAFVVRALECLRNGDKPAKLERLETSLRARGADIAEFGRRESRRQAANQVTVGNCVTSLRLLGALDWEAFFERTSLVERILRQDPAGVYSNQDFATRDRCRRVLERLARGSKCPELTVAQRALDCARERAATSASLQPAAHVGFYLIGSGRRALESKLHYRPALRAWLLEMVLRHPQAAYFGSICLLASAFLTALLASQWGSTISLWLWVLLGIAAALPIGDLAVGIANFLWTLFLPPRVLPKLEFKDGIPADCATFVVMPSMLVRPQSAAALVQRLEIHFLANPDAHLYFALLTDFSDAATETRPEDDAYITDALTAIEALNRRYATDGPPRFFLIHRRRRWNPVQGCWMGWERKRGKLVEFNRLLRGSRDTSSAVCSSDPARLPKIRYVITLDLDTQLPHDAARRLVGTLAHPLNRPRFDPACGRVVEGYAVLQPRVSFQLAAANRSWFSRLWVGSAGLDPYVNAVSDIYQDLFGAGSFTGKGIYEVDAFEAATGHSFPDNQILSHDLIEANYARCCLATDIELFDDFPARYHAYARREHRWVRGDWQLLPWLGPRVPVPVATEGAEPSLSWRPNPLPALERWKLLDNLRRSLVPLALCLWLVLSWTVLPLSEWLATLAALSVIFLPLGLQIFAAGLSLLRGSLAGVRELGQTLAPTLGQVTLSFVFLLDQAWRNADAILRTLARLLITRRRLLDWETAASAERRLGADLKSFWLDMWPASALAIALTALVICVRPGALGSAGVILAAWFLAPVVAFLVSQPRVEQIKPLTADQENELRRIARKTWTFFETFVGAADHWLPPDNYQQAPTPKVAHRTSPTNIGLCLLSTLAAHDLGYLNLSVLLERLENTIATLEKLERYRGHLFNWYSTLTLEPLEPRYISTVDSGNLLASLLTLKQGLLEKAKEGMPEPAGDISRRCQALAERADVLATAMDFRFLYKQDRNLFAIGFNVSQQRLDGSCYDLLASEARLASFLAIARGVAPRSHWFRLGRLLTRFRGQLCLLSWGGTMFEYLMPQLVLRCPGDTLLAESCQAAVDGQIDYGKSRAVPWGISESAFSSQYASSDYQYQSFGVPGLGLKRGLSQDLVVAPYATALAVGWNAAAALANFQRLQAAGGEGVYGFYESIDYTRSRLPDGQSSVVVRCFMAHHQGMSLVALANCLLGQPMVRRFHAEPMVRATELLLQERVPHGVSPVDASEPAVAETAAATSETPTLLSRRVNAPDTPTPRTHLLSGGPYTVMISNAGSGFSRARAVDVTRWREDATRDCWGQFFYIRDVEDGRFWSAGHQPVCRPADDYEVEFAVDKAEIRRRDGNVATNLEVTVSPEQPVEVRRLTLANHGPHRQILELTSYAELVLGPHGADQAHPAFGKLFMQTEWLPSHQALLCRRRRRSPDETEVWAVHVAAIEESVARGPLEFETERSRFIGRGRSLASPAALAGDGPLSGSVGPVLDPIFSLRCRLHLPPGSSAVVLFCTALAGSRDEALALADQYRVPHASARVFDLAWAHAQLELRQLRINSSDAHLYQQAAAYLLYPSHAVREVPEIAGLAPSGQAALWRLGISGDLPIVVVSVTASDEMPLVGQLLTAHSYWRQKGLAADLVLLNEMPSGYFDDLHQQLLQAVSSSDARELLDRHGGVFVRKRDAIAADELQLLFAAARFVLKGNRGSLTAQLNHEVAAPALPARLPRTLLQNRRSEAAPAAFVSLPSDLLFPNGLGGFTADGKEYVVLPYEFAAPEQRWRLKPTPAPWANVVANPQCGFLATDSGLGATWVGNSQLYRLTPWSNDPVTDAPAEIVYVRDEETGTVWSPTPQPLGDGKSTLVRHGQGYTRYQQNYDGLEQELLAFVPSADIIKIIQLRVRNGGAFPRRLSATFYADWVLGGTRAETAAYIQTAIDAETGALLARNPFPQDFSEQIAFADVSLRPRTFTGDRCEFLGRNGSPTAPAALTRTDLSGHVGTGLDPCAALQAKFTLEPGESKEITFFLGAAPDLSSVRTLVKLYKEPSRVDTGFAQIGSFWNDFLSSIQVHTPDRAINLMLNHWLPYQVLSCRLWGRCGFYQSSGAYGFRDQLQDVLALVYGAPSEARNHLLRAAARQFAEGDVQHWWHPPAGRGARTRISDDFLWLPFAVHHYVTVTGDAAVLDEAVPFLQAPPLAAGESDSYGLPATTEPGILYDHCVRALEHGLRFGAHGLPLMGSGDWNDGMNLVGREGRGESVWLAWFLLTCLNRFSDLAETRGDPKRALSWRSAAESVRQAAETHGWDGAWYRRAYDDAGAPLGSAQNDECQIDSIAQTWAVICGAANPQRCAQAMGVVYERLVRPAEGVALLLSPPFAEGPAQPGYIKAYVPGVRENGGQYTHAAAWLVQAAALQKQGTRAIDLLSMLLPTGHTGTAEAVARYRGEPYVLAGDVYAEPHAGRAGWTWYTGSAAWMYRVALETVLGFQLRGSRLTLDPCISSTWPSFAIIYRYRSATYHISVENPHALETGHCSIVVDGQVVTADSLELRDDQRSHQVRVVILK